MKTNVLKNKKNNLIKISTILVFSFMCSFINAGTTNKCNVHIGYTTQSSNAGFDMKASVCENFKRAIDENGNEIFNNVYDGYNYLDAKMSFSDWLVRVSNKSTLSGKGTVSSVQYYQRCNDEGRKVTATTTCYFTATKTPKLTSQNVKYASMSCVAWNTKPNCEVIREIMHDANMCAEVGGVYRGKLCTYQKCTTQNTTCKRIACPSGYTEVPTGSQCIQCPSGTQAGPLSTNGHVSFGCISCDAGYTYNRATGICVYNEKSKVFTTEADDSWITGGDYGFEGESANQSKMLDICKKYKDEIGADSIECTSCGMPRYHLTCPVYQCIPETKTFEACTPSFQVNNSPAYCINPNQNFDSNTTNNYQVADFDVNNCSSSYSTIDCGYANIMIEGNYYHFSDKVIDLAMRLWGAHSGGAGYDNSKPGVSQAMGNNCSKQVAFVASGNVYASGYSRLWRIYMDNIAKQKFDYIDPTKPDNYFFDKFDSLSCSEFPDGMCGNRTTMKQAAALFFNTVFGNKYMKEHLDSLFGNEVDTRPNSARVETEKPIGGEEESKVVLTFDRKITNTERVQYSCKKIQEDAALIEQGKTTGLNYPELNSDNRNYISQYCTVEVKHLYAVDINGQKYEIDINDSDKIYDASKGELIIESEYFAVCDKNSSTTYKKYKIEIEYKKSTSGYSVRKYVACPNPDNAQTMFAFYKKEEINNSGTTTTESGFDEVSYDITFNCQGNCSDYSVRSSRPVCQNKENSVYTGYIKDPSLSCIVNMDSIEYKNYYDYSDYFKVNRNFCRVYCSDEVEYSLADNIKAVSGREFTYDIKPFEAFNTETKKLSSGISMKRKCVSEIYFDKPFPDSIDWERIYGITNRDLSILPGDDKTITNWKDLFAVLYAKSQSEGSRRENLNQLIYDLYNCNFAKESDIPSSVWKPVENTTGNINNYIKSIYGESNNYGINTEWKNSVTYNGGAEVINKVSSQNKPYTIGSGSSDIDMQKISSSKLSDVSYCKGICLEYNATKENYSYNEFNSTNILNNKERFTNIDVPANDYALFEVSTQVGFYNNSEFQVEAYSGKIIDKSKNTSKTDVINLDKYSYPLSKQAYNECKKLDNGLSRCDVTQTLSDVSTYYRKRASDGFTNELKSQNFTKFTCSVDVKEPSVTVLPDSTSASNSLSSIKTNTIYRNVDLNNLFPDKESRKDLQTNWTTSNGVNATNQIQNTANDLIGTEKYLEYSFELTPSSIRKIKDYNQSVKNSGSYMNDTIEKDSCDVVDNKFLNCTSKFLTDLRNGSYGVNVIKGDGISEYTSNK